MPIVIGSTDWAVLRSVQDHHNVYEVVARFTSCPEAWLWAHDKLPTLASREDFYVAPCCGGEYFDLQIVV